MSDESGAPAGDIAAPAIISDGSDTTFENASQAAEAYAAALSKPAESADPATAEPELSDEGSPESPKVETTEEDQETEPTKSAIEPPKSWTKDLHEHWGNLDPVLQERIVARDREDQAAIKRSFNEAAEMRKAVEAERTQAVQERKALADKLPQVESAIQEFLSNKYPDIRSMDDVSRMANEAHALWPTDPFRAGEIGARLKAWEVDQQKIALTLSSAKEAKDAELKDQKSNFLKQSQEESKKLAEFVTSADIEKYSSLAPQFFEKLGFSQEERVKIGDGEKLSPFDHRMQLMAFKAMKYDELRASPVKAVPAVLPPVQRPGVAKVSTSTASEREQALTNEFNKTGSLKAAQELYALQSSKQRRAS